MFISILNSLKFIYVFKIFWFAIDNSYLLFILVVLQFYFDYSKKNHIWHYSDHFNELIVWGMRMGFLVEYFIGLERVVC